jgi:hypothetical protein
MPAIVARVICCETCCKDSKADWPEPLRAPKGAPNVLLIMGDDIGYARGRGKTRDMR